MHVLVISCSLNPQSRSHLMARAAGDALRQLGAEVEMMDLRQMQLPFCDGGETAEADPRVAKSIGHADAIVLCTPIYNYDVSAATKNLIELTSTAWIDKVVGFCCAAGGRTSYMAAMGLAGSLMLDFRCLIVPRFVYATYDDFDDDRIDNPTVVTRIGQLAADVFRIGGALRKRVLSPEA